MLYFCRESFNFFPMYAIDFINKNVPVLRTSNTLADALSIMEELKISHLPIVNDKELLGLLSENALLCHDDFSQAIGSVDIDFNVSVDENSHIFDFLKSINEHHLSLLPIVSKDNYYLGSIITKDLVIAVADMFSVRPAWSRAGW